MPYVYIYDDGHQTVYTSSRKTAERLKKNGFHFVCSILASYLTVKGDENRSVMNGKLFNAMRDTLEAPIISKNRSV